MLRAEACACTTEACADQAASAIELERQRVEQELAAGEACLVTKGLAGPAEKILRKMGEFRDQICACRDKACVDQVEKSMMEWAMKNLEEMQEIAKKATEAENAKADVIDADIDKCKARAEGTAP
jgi:hypothetical protein